MKPSLTGIMLVTLIAACMGQRTVAADFGRLFLSHKERMVLEKLRNAKPEPEEPVVQQVEPDPLELLATEQEQAEAELPQIEVEPVLQIEEPIILRGVVKRGDNKNTAWLNNGNTMAGNDIVGKIRLDERDIKQDSVSLTLPDNVTEVTLKVGQAYEPRELPDNEAE